MTKSNSLKIFTIILSALLPVFVSAEEALPITAENALTQLVEGNARYAAGQSKHQHQDTTRRQEVTSGQNPIAAILSCSDSRVPPEIIFDQGIGDLFVVRVAGQVLDDTALASLEYAIEHLDVPLIVVLGHERCGAVTAAVAGGHLPGHISALADKIKPVIKDKNADVEQCISDNAKHVAQQLKESKPILEEYLKEGKIKIHAAKYDLDTGKVELF